MSFRRRFQCTKISAACIIVPAFLLTLLFLRSNYQSEFDPDSILSTNEKDRIKGRIGYEVIGNNELFYNTTEKIAIVAVVENVDNISLYEFPIRTIQCYSKIQQYHYVLALASDFDCNMKDKFFRRHCVVAKILPNFEAVLFIDADIGVVNPKRRIEEYMDSNFDVVFYDRFYNWEITAGSYIVRNTSFAVKFLENFAKFETRLPESFHGTDNGGLHLYVAEVLYPSHPRIKKCEQVYQRSANYDDLFSFEACIRSILGPKTDFDRIRIMHKGTGWSRDNWLTNSLWNAERDFMIHGWKTNQYLRTPMDPGIIESSRGAWYNPLVGPIMLEKCSPSNSSWDYDPRLITPTSRIKKKLDDFEREIDKSQILSLARISKFL